MSLKVLIAIPHIFAPREGSLYSSEKIEKKGTKESALKEATLGNMARQGKDCWIHASLGKGRPVVTRQLVSSQGIDLTIQIYTQKGFSLAKVGEPNGAVGIIEPKVDNLLEMPLNAARGALKQADNYDIIGYMEDDLAIYDPYFFQKIHWLSERNGPSYAFLPHRCEFVSGKGDVILSGDPDGGRPDLFWDTGEELICRWTFGEVSFYRATNPHSGCWFLSQKQAIGLREYWEMKNWKADFQLSGPLEQAGSGILLPAFKVMKPKPKDYRFLMIRHQDTLWKRHPMEDGSSLRER